jgi:hypothetical protein
MTFHSTLRENSVKESLKRYLIHAMLRNHSVALFAQAFIVGPLVRHTHERSFPVSALVSQA